MKVRTAPSITAQAAVDEFIESCESLLNRLEDLPEAADDFVTNVRETLEGMVDTARTQRRVTTNMRNAVDNIEGGVFRWENPRG